MKKPLPTNKLLVVPVLTAVSTLLIFIAGNTASILLWTTPWLVLNVGTIVFAFTFFWKDLIQKKMGKNFAIVNNIIASLLVLLISLEIGIVSGNVGFVWAALLICSFFSNSIAETIDSIIYARVKGNVKPALVSNAISVPIDTIIFSYFGFYLVLGMPVQVVLGLAVAQMLVKFTLAGIVSPLLRFVKRTAV